MIGNIRDSITEAPANSVLQDLTKNKRSFSFVPILWILTTCWSMFCHSSSTSGWQQLDIGESNVSGNALESNGLITLNGSGFDIESESDQFFYFYTQRSGDFSFQIKVNSVEKTNRWAKGALMIRDNLDEDSPNVALAYSAHQRITMHTRNNSGESSRRWMSKLNHDEIFLKLDRVGNLFSGYYSQDGINWTLANSKIVTLTDEVYIGLSASPRQLNGSNLVKLSNLKLLPDSNENNQNKKAKVYLMAGQSNMEGHGLNSELPFTTGADLTEQRDDVIAQTIISRTNGPLGLLPGLGASYKKFGVELKFGHVMGNVLDEKVYLFKGSKGGTSLIDPEHWRPQQYGGVAGNYYEQLIVGFNDFKLNYLEANNVDYEVAGFIWFQGYNDTFGNENLYKSHLENLILAIRGDLNLPDLKLIITQINDNKGFAGDIVRQAQADVANADPKAELVTTGDLRPYYHYGSDSYIVIGERIAQAALKQLNYPSGENDEYQVSPNTQLLINTNGVLVNDSGINLQARLVEMPKHGAVNLSMDGHFDYLPSPGFRGKDEFSYIPFNSEVSGQKTRVRIWVRDQMDPLAFHFNFDFFEDNLPVDISSGLKTVNRGNAVQYIHQPPFGNSAYFDGAGYLQYMTTYPVYDFLDLSTEQDFSIAMWIKPDADITSEQILISNKYYYKKNSGFAMTTTSDGMGIQAYIGAHNHTTKINTSSSLISDTVNLTDGNWHHITGVFSFSQKTMRIYIDGVEVGIKDITNLSGDINQYVPSIGDGSGGGDGKSNAYKGYMDEIAFYNKTLTSDEILNLFQNIQSK